SQYVAIAFLSLLAKLERNFSWKSQLNSTMWNSHGFKNSGYAYLPAVPPDDFRKIRLCSDNSHSAVD
ncbi:MAG: hypothetical protein KAQ67_07555, partial [Gammaproteobacteria bacterium]|nr:hypothetical protein [Gammaproteobacteria bacterium]